MINLRCINRYAWQPLQSDRDGGGHHSVWWKNNIIYQFFQFVRIYLNKSKNDPKYYISGAVAAIGGHRHPTYIVWMALLEYIVHSQRIQLIPNFNFHFNHSGATTWMNSLYHNQLCHAWTYIGLPWEGDLGNCSVRKSWILYKCTHIHSNSKLMKIIDYRVSGKKFLIHCIYM